MASNLHAKISTLCYSSAFSKRIVTASERYSNRIFPYKDILLLNEIIKMAKINIFKKSFQSFIKIIVASMHVCQTTKRPERCKCFSDETWVWIPLNIWTCSIPTKHKWISDTAEKPLHQWCDSKRREESIENLVLFFARDFFKTERRGWRYLLCILYQYSIRQRQYMLLLWDRSLLAPCALQ